MRAAVDLCDRAYSACRQASNGGSIVDMEVVVQLRGVIAKLSRRLNASATHQGLTPSQASALGLISWRETVSLAELTELEGLNPTMVSRIVGRLDELELIRRTPNPQDLRSALVEITPTGRALNERIRAERGSVVATCLDQLPDTDRTAIAAALPALGRLAEQLKNAGGGGAGSTPAQQDDRGR